MSKRNDMFGNRMKSYEMRESERRLLEMLPVVARMDGIGFHNWTKGLERPYDAKLSQAMVETTEFLLGYFGANVGYTQSDEITLGWHLPDYNSELFCSGRILKLTSYLSSKTSVKFNSLLPILLPSKVGTEPCFDARVFNVPNLTEAANEFLWREQDATRNSISMAAHAYFSQKELHGKSRSEMQDMLFLQRQINWNNYPNYFKRGTFILRRTVYIPFTAEEIQSLPPKHMARTNPDFKVERTKLVRYNDLPKFSSIVNREGFLFLGQEPDEAK